MAIQTNLSVTLQLNTAGGTNNPSPTDTFTSLVSAGASFLAPNTISVPATGSTVAPFSSLTASNTSFHIMIWNTGVAGSQNIILDMKSVAPNSSQLAIAPGGRVYFFNCSQLPGATVTNTNPAAWTLSSATGAATTASTSIVYT